MLNVTASNSTQKKPGQPARFSFCKFDLAFKFPYLPADGVGWAYPFQIIFSPRERMEAMDLDSAIVSHSSWKNKLRTYLEKKDGSLIASEVQSDQKCPLGQWIYGEGQKWSGNPTFAELKMHHTAFHAAAAALVRKVDLGQSVREEIEVGAKSEFSKCTASVVNTLAKLKKEIH